MKDLAPFCAGWKNTQTGIGKSIEQYGTSWTRDLMRAKSFANPAFLASLPATGSLSNGITDANYTKTLTSHSSHGAGMNFDLGINYSYITGAFLSTTMAVAGINTNLSTQPQPDPTTHVVQWSNQYALDLISQLPNYQTLAPKLPNYLNDPLHPGMNLQQAALRDFLSLYSVTRDNGAEAYGWDNLPISNGSDAQKVTIRTALFGDGTAAGSMMRSVVIGGKTGNGQARYPGIEGVLTALGVPPNKKDTFYYKDHQHHFHVNIQPPTPSNKPVEILPSTKKLLADGVVADASPNQGILIAATATVAQGQYDVAYSICQTVAPVGGVDYPVANAIYPTMAAGKYFDDRGIHTEGSDLPKVTLIDAPKHGELQHGDVDWVYLYNPNKDYFGGDRMIFSVEVKGKVFKVIYSVDVVQAPGAGSPSCPNSLGIKELKNSAAGRNKHGSLDIWELPSATQFDVETLAQMHSAIGFGLEDMGLSNANVTFADLAGAAVGQTTGTSITLDTTAAGNGWFVDSTPSDNSEYLPTSNPNEWIAKAGTAAAGKMDMLSVLLHEYGHALGIDHSANPNDFMATTLTAGVRRLPSAAEMALMQQLIAQAKTGVMTAQTGSNSATDQPNNTPLPIIPLGGFGIAFAGLLQRNRYGGLSIAADPSSVVTQYAVAANATLTNGSLNSGTGWATQGSVDIANGVATLNEVATRQTRLSQVFMLGANDRYLSFTLSGAALDAPHPLPNPPLEGAGTNAALRASEPSDAFEVALLNANTGASLLDNNGLTHSDAFLSSSFLTRYIGFDLRP